MVELCDVTLREGEQTPGAFFDWEDKIELARMLDEIGLSQIQVSFPGLDRERLRETARICSLPLRSKTEVMTNGMVENWREHISAACACGSDIVHAMIDSRKACSSADEGRKTLERIEAICEHVHTAGKLSNISFIGAFDAERRRLVELIQRTTQITDRLRVADSYGVASPEDVFSLVTDMLSARGSKPCRLGIHCHDDMGLAMTNMLAAVHAGIDFVDVSINGLGSRAGNVPLAACAYVLDRVYHCSAGIDMARLRELSRRTSEVCGIPTPSHMALVGDRVFDEEIEIHVLELLEHVERRGLLPEEVGGEAHPLYGKLTTAQILRSLACSRTRQLSEKQIEKILGVLHAYSHSHRGAVLDEAGLWDIVDGIQRNNAGF